MKRIISVILGLLVLGGGALAVAQEPAEPADQAAAVPPPEKPQDAARLNPLAAEVDKAIKASIGSAGRTAVAAEAKPVADAGPSDCMLVDEHMNIQVLLTEECVAEVRSRLAEVEREQPSAIESEPDGDRQRP